MAHLLLVEDDDYLRQELIATLSQAGYTVTGLAKGPDPFSALLSYEPDLVILDLNLPGASGFNLCRWLKEKSQLPVLVLTARDTLGDELACLKLGADDFLTKPCHPKRLLARIHNLLKLYESHGQLLQTGRLFLDPLTHKISWQGQALLLAEREGKIMSVLMAKHPAAASQKELLTRVWQSEAYLDENILAVNINRLRKRLAELPSGVHIETVRGFGYRLEVVEP